MSTSLLTRNQERRLVTHLRLLLDDLDALATLPELERAGQPGGRVRDLVDEARAAARALRAKLGLPEDRGTALARRVGATAEVWAVRVEDLRARRLRAYGDVHPDLAPTLDPPLDQLRRALVALAEAAGELPER
ncbi:MAG TPA: hypothetical protein VKO86_12480 [Gemmatimonadales bacterium]|nr:hypothetical protein [Gemmatimonadales bacterium]